MRLADRDTAVRFPAPFLWPFLWGGASLVRAGRYGTTSNNPRGESKSPVVARSHNKGLVFPRQVFRHGDDLAAVPDS
eukprot:170183-Pyramimonas_sp.AAC.1